MKRFPRSASLALIVVLLLAMLAACTPAATTTSQPPASNATTAPAGSAATTAPAGVADATKGPPDIITVWSTLDAGKVAPIYADYSDAPIQQWIEEALNVDLQFQHPPAGEEQNKFSLMLAGREMTDVINRDFVNTANYPGGAVKAIEDGVIIALNDLMDQGKFPNLTAYFDKHPDWIKHWINDDGLFVCTPFIREHPLLWTSWGFMGRLDWMEEYGYSDTNMPDTIAEIEELLYAFKNDGKSEYPLLIYDLAGWGDNGILPGAWDVGWEWYRDRQGELQYGPTQDAFRSFLEKMIEWNKAGLIDPDWQGGNNDQIRRTKAMTTAGMWFLNVGGGMGTMYDTINAAAGTSTVPANPEGYRAYAIPQPTLEEGQKSRFGGSALPVAGMQAFISTNAKNLDAVARYLDFGYGEEGDLMMNFGKEGVNFEYINYKDFDVPVDLSEFGDKFPRWTDVVYKAEDGQPLSIALSRYVFSHMGGSFAQDVGYIVQFLPYHDQLASVNKWVETSDFTGQLLPRMYFTTAESEEMAAIETDMRTYKNETVTGFLNLSTELNDTTWAAFQAGLKQMGIDRVLEIRRAAFEKAENR